MDVILLLACSYWLHHQANKKGVSPWPYVLNFVGIFMAATAALVAGIIMFTGVSVSDLNFEQIQELTANFVPFVLLFETMLFVVFLMRINKLPDYKDEDDNNHHTHYHNDDDQKPPKEKKDLSYFR
jgi:flagellar biosynthesis protein FliQ